MRKLILFGLVLAAYAGPACAADPMAMYYGNTVILSNAGQSDRQLRVERDGTYTVAATDGTAVKGNWAVNDGTVCYTQSEPAPAKPYCIAADQHKVGDSWDMVGPDGKPVTITLKAGR